MNIAIIPARGGSKRIPRKNIKNFFGKPMIAYAILAAKQANIFDHIIVSTDDEEILEIAKKWGAETPFVRDKELSDDYTPTVPVIYDAIKKCEVIGWNINMACCIYPCNPLLKANDIRESLNNLLKEPSANYCFPVAEFPSPIQRALRCDSRSKLSALQPEHELTRTQDLEKSYYDAGQFYWGSKESWASQPKIHTNSIGYIIPNHRVIDIDNLDDWKRAELIFQSIANQK
jgi:pseudaminic acid cytidylyltransferase